MRYNIIWKESTEICMKENAKIWIGLTCSEQDQMTGLCEGKVYNYVLSSEIRSEPEYKDS